MPESESPSRPPRRPRYRGTHPRRYEERYKELQREKYPDIEAHIRAQGRTPAGTHVPILVDQVLQALDPHPGEIVADCTVGFGGHAEVLARRIGPTGRLVGFDVDEPQLARAAERLESTGTPFSLHRSHFAGLGKILAAEGLAGFDIIFADLGASSMQFDDPSRGFSYKKDGPLDMRMDQRLKTTAADLLARLSPEELSSAFRDLADEPDHERIARKVAATREHEPITRTVQLTRIVLRAKRITPEAERARAAAGRGAHPAARIFQALRILVNDEIGQLKELLRAAPYCLSPGGRIGILSFHSGEDGRVVEAYRSGFEQGIYEDWTAEPIRADRAERRENPRSSAALFRWARRSESN